MWGSEPTDAALATLKLFQEHQLEKILIPGFGYGRNEKPFTDAGFLVTGVEISETAIRLARQYYGNSITIHHGPVSAMPFDDETYDGVFCYALIHLLDEEERAKLIDDCYRQLRPGGYMVFVDVSKNDAMYGSGREVSKDRFETRHGVQLFFYDAAAVETEFGRYGLIEYKEIDEPVMQTGNKPSLKFWYITCRK